MWLMTPRGFFSVVQHRDDPDTVLIRARARGDLVRLQAAHPAGEEHEIVDTFSADYPHRIFMPRVIWNEALLTMSNEVDYDNFKNAVKDRQHAQRARVYMGVWSKLHQIEWEERRPEEYTQPSLGDFRDTAEPEEWRCDQCLQWNDSDDEECCVCFTARDMREYEVDLG
jgi:hypothetical protein